MTLRELEQQVANAIEMAKENDEAPEEIPVTLQFDNENGESLWSGKGVELHYDGGVFTSGCVLLAHDPESD